MYIVILNVVFVIAVIFLIFDSAVESLKSISDLLSVSSSTGKIFSSLLKAGTVCILTKLASDIAKESGNATVSDMIDFGGRIMLLIISLPFIESIIKTATAFIT